MSHMGTPRSNWRTAAGQVFGRLYNKTKELYQNGKLDLAVGLFGLGVGACARDMQMVNIGGVLAMVGINRLERSILQKCGVGHRPHGPHAAPV